MMHVKVSLCYSYHSTSSKEQQGVVHMHVEAPYMLKQVCCDMHPTIAMVWCVVGTYAIKHKC